MSFLDRAVITDIVQNHSPGTLVYFKNAHTWSLTPFHFQKLFDSNVAGLRPKFATCKWARGGQRSPRICNMKRYRFLLVGRSEPFTIAGHAWQLGLEFRKSCRHHNPWHFKGMLLCLHARQQSTIFNIFSLLHNLLSSHLFIFSVLLGVGRNIYSEPFLRSSAFESRLTLKRGGRKIWGIRDLLQHFSRGD